MSMDWERIERRGFLGHLVLLAGGGLLAGCGSCKGQSAGGQPQGFRSTVEDLPAKLERLRLVFEKAGHPIDNYLQPGLSREEIDARTRELPFRLPEELYALYMWRNGTKQDTTLFLFRDQFFSSLEEGMANLKALPFFGVPKAFPFAAFEGSFYVLPIEPHSADPRYERPVVSVFEGVDVYFLSLSRMLDTVIDWFEQDVRKPVGGVVQAEREMAVWRQHNPGVFP